MFTHGFLLLEFSFIFIHNSLLQSMTKKVKNRFIVTLCESLAYPIKNPFKPLNVLVQYPPSKIYQISISLCYAI